MNLQRPMDGAEHRPARPSPGGRAGESFPACGRSRNAGPPRRRHAGPLHYLRRRRIERPREAVAGTSDDQPLPGLAQETTSTPATTTQIRRTDAQILTLTARHKAHGRAESPVTVDDNTRTRAIKIARSVSRAPAAGGPAQAKTAPSRQTCLIQGRYELGEPLPAAAPASSTRPSIPSSSARWP